MSRDDFYLPPDPYRRRLTRQELRILRMVAMGMPARAIAHLLELSYYTVKCHKTNIYDALSLERRNQTMAVVTAARMGIL